MSAALDAAGMPPLVDVSRRWQAADALLPAPALPRPDGSCDAVFTVPGEDQQLLAVAACEHWQDDPESLELTWGAARRFQLTPRVGGPDVAAVLDELLALWRAHLAGVASTDDPDSAAVVLWPSRDIDGVAPLLRRGLAPRGVVAARRAPRLLADAGWSGGSARHRQATVPALVVRQAGLDDADTVSRLGVDVIKYDAHFGGVVERPSTGRALHAEVAAMLAEPEPWIWLAERDRQAVGVLIAEPPPAGWIVPMVGAAPVAYNMLTWVSPADRGSGAAAALVGCFHSAADAASVEATLLHYEQTNPLSAPFWARQGYRPLWTSWEARPACTMR